MSNQNEVTRTSQIKVEVGLDDKNIPVSIQWQATDNPEQAELQPCKAVLLSLFDQENKETLKIDLWTKEMQIVEMDRFVYQTLRALADTYYRATQNAELASDMQRFVQYFGEKTEVIPKADQ